MKLKAFESFGVVPFLFYTILGGVIYKIAMYIVESSGLRNDISVMTGSWLFLIPSGFALGLTLIAMISRFTPQIRKTFGFMLGALLPLLWQHHSGMVFLASLGLGFLVGIATITRQEKQLKLVKDIAPIPFLLLTIPPISEVALSLQKGNYTQNIDIFLGYVGLIVILFVETIIIRKTSNHALKDEETSEEVTIFLGPRQSGKTILSLGFYYELVTGRRGTHEGSFVISEEGTPLELSELYGIFRRNGFSGVKGTQKSWLSINTFRIKRKSFEKILFGLKDIELEITDYAGEILWDLEAVFRDSKKYDDLVKEIEQDIEADFESFMRAIRYPTNTPAEERQKIAKTLQKRIIKDIENRNFDFRNYHRRVYWEKIPEGIRTKLAIAHTMSSLLRADKIVPLLDGEGILYEMYQRDTEVEDRLNELKDVNPTLYELIMGSIRKFERQSQALDVSIEARKATLEAQLKAYDVILSRFKKLNKRGDFAFLVTKADLIAGIFMPILININPRSIKKRVLRILTRTAAFINLAQKLIPEKQLEEKLMFSVILSPADLKKIDPESAEELQDEILVRGLRDLIEWVRKTPGARKIKEVLLP